MLNDERKEKLGECEEFSPDDNKCEEPPNGSDYSS